MPDEPKFAGLFLRQDIRAENQPTRFIDIAPELILERLKVGHRGLRIGDALVQFCEDAIPDEARCVGAEITELGYVRLYVQHESFDDERQMTPKYTETPIDAD